MNIITLTCRTCRASSSNTIEGNRWRVATPTHEPWCRGDPSWVPAEQDVEADTLTDTEADG